jgi:hypothetical protein
MKELHNESHRNLSAITDSNHAKIKLLIVNFKEEIQESQTIYILLNNIGNQTLKIRFLTKIKAFTISSKDKQKKRVPGQNLTMRQQQPYMDVDVCRLGEGTSDLKKKGEKQTGKRNNSSSSPRRVKNFPFFTGSRAYPALNPMRISGSLPGGQSCQGVKLTTRHQLVPRSIHPFSQTSS